MRNSVRTRWGRAVSALGCAAAMVVVVSAGTAGAGSGKTLYETDFSDPATVAPKWGFARGVTSESGEGFTLTMTPGAYTITHEGASNVWTSPTVRRLPDDQVVEATISDTTGDPTLIAGVVCRGSVDENKGYGFFIGLDGYYSIGTFGATGGRLVANVDGTDRTDAVDPDGPNTVRGECVGIGKKKVRVTLFVNDEKVASAVDRTAPSKIGPNAYLISEVGRNSPASVTFSEYRVGAR